MKTLNVMGLDFTYKAAIRGYESVTLTREWNGVGSMNLTINSEITNATDIQENDLLWFDKEYSKVFIVDQIEESVEGSTKHIKVIARHINSLLSDYITIPPSGQSHDVYSSSREGVVRGWVDNNMGPSAVIDRRQYPIAFATYTALGEGITEQTRYQNLMDEVSRIMAPENLGWLLVLNPTTEKFVFTIRKGVDRTSGQSINSRVLFGLKYGNLANYRKVKNSTSSKNIAIVAGKGEGADRTVIQVDRFISGRKKEVFIDARDIDVVGELVERGEQALSELDVINSFEFETLDRQFVYGVDYDLGDFVTVVIDMNDAQDLQIKNVTEVYERDNITIRPSFGKPERTIGSVFGGMSSRVSRLETNEPPVQDTTSEINDSATTLTNTWSASKINGLIPVGDANWTAPTFQNSWVNYGDIYETAGYIKDALGFVHIRGLVKSGTANTTIFTLPVGYRPNKSEIFTVMANQAICRLEVSANGTVAHSVGTNAWVSLAGITFKAV